MEGQYDYLTRAVSPLFSRLFPDIPKNHPSIGSMMMNFSANMLGLDNAATPLGLKAMKELQEINPDKERASNAQIMFLVLNTSGLTIIPISIFALRSGAESPTEVFLPILISTFIASLAGLIFVAIRQRINLLNGVVLSYIGGLILTYRSDAFLCCKASQSRGSRFGNRCGEGLCLELFLLLSYWQLERRSMCMSHLLMVQKEDSM